MNSISVRAFPETGAAFAGTGACFAGVLTLGGLATAAAAGGVFTGTAAAAPDAAATGTGGATKVGLTRFVELSFSSGTA